MESFVGRMDDGRSIDGDRIRVGKFTFIKRVNFRV